MTVSNVSKRRNPKRDDLQGIRALAILSVLGFHFYPNYFPNGYLGVDQWYLKQSNKVIAVIIMGLFISNILYINKDEIQKRMEKKEEVQLTSGKKYPRLDGITVNMTTLDDAERMNAYWNKVDHRGPEMIEPNCVRRNSKHKWYDFKENGTEFKFLLSGSSYVKNHHKMFIQECKNRATMISMDDVIGCEPLASPHKPVENDGNVGWTKVCAGKLKEFVDFVKETQPDYVFFFTRWFAVGEPYDTNENDLDNDTIYKEMKSQLKQFLPNIKKKLFILDSFPRKSLANPSSFERGRRRHAELIKKECGSKCELIDYVDAFWNKTMNAFQYFDSKGFSYFTTGHHLSPHGIEHVRHIYTKICNNL